MRAAVSGPPKEPQVSRLSSTLLESARDLEIRLAAMALSILQGDRLSGLQGRGLEVSGVREYEGGDEARAVDWRVTARTGRLHVKEFEEERDLPSMVILHRSWDLLGGRGGIRMIRALEISGLLSALALKEGDRGGLLQGGVGCRTFLPPARNQNQLQRIVASLLEPAQDGLCEALPSLLDRARKLARERSRIFLVAGFHCPGPVLEETREGLGRLSEAHALIPVRVLDGAEGVFDGPWPIPLEDPAVGVFSPGREERRDEGLREALNWEDEAVGEMFRGLGLREMRVDVSQPLLPTLRACLARHRCGGGPRV